MEGGMDKANIAYMYNGILFSLKKEGNPVICNNPDGPRGHYGKRNQPVTEGRMPYNFLIREPKVVKLIEESRERTDASQGQGGGGKAEMLPKG